MNGALYLRSNLKSCLDSFLCIDRFSEKVASVIVFKFMNDDELDVVLRSCIEEFLNYRS